jgi:N-acetylmuramoyl-L-alanine amidase
MNIQTKHLVPWLRLIFVLLLVLFPLWAKATALTGLRLGQTPDQTRIVFELSNQQGFEISRLTQPDRLVVDFFGAKNGLSFHRRQFQDKRIARIRVSDDASRTRVVLDLRQAYQFKYFTLAKSGTRPERLVIDLTQPMLAKNQPAPITAAKPAAIASVTPAPKKPAKVAVVSAPAPKKVEPTKPSVSVVASNKVAPSKNKPQANQATEALLNQNQDFVIDKEFIVAIDAGHGGRDSGAVGPTGVKEKHVTLELAKQLKAMIDLQPGMRGVLTREGDVYLGLRERVEIAKRAKADIFISIHADAYTSKAPRGGSVYVLSNRGASSVMAQTLAQSENESLGVVQLAGGDQDLAFVLSDLTREANLRASRKLGKTVIAQMQRHIRMHKKQVQSANFAVLRSIDMPSMLIEAAFISNPYEEKQLRTDAFQRTFAQAVTNGLKAFIEKTGHQPRWGETLYVNHQVKPGDTLSVLAQSYGITTQQLMRLNNIRNANQLYVGRKLRVPVTEKLTVQYEKKYTVKRGDTLSQIAQGHNVSQQALMQVNKIRNANQLYVGRELIIPMRQQVLAAAK